MSLKGIPENYTEQITENTIRGMGNLLPYQKFSLLGKDQLTKQIF